MLLDRRTFLAQVIPSATVIDSLAPARTAYNEFARSWNEFALEYNRNSAKVADLNAEFRTLQPMQFSVAALSFAQQISFRRVSKLWDRIKNQMIGG